MSSEIVKYQWQNVNLELTKDDVRNLISTSKEVTDKEIMLFLQLCKYQKLNPFVREAYLIKYGTSPARIVVGKEVFTKRAELNPDFDGYDITDNWNAKMSLEEFEVTCKVYRKNLTHPITITVSYSEYVGTDGAGKVNHMWKGKPRTMLRKVSLMQGLREAFPTDLGGLYEENELDQQTIPKDISIKEEKDEPEKIKKEYAESKANEAKLKKDHEEGKDKIKNYSESKIIYKKKKEEGEKTEAEINPKDLEEVFKLLNEIDIQSWNQGLYYARKANLKVGDTLIATIPQLKKLLTEDREKINRLADARMEGVRPEFKPKPFRSDYNPSEAEE